jgi:hypothetical protein
MEISRRPVVFRSQSARLLNYDICFRQHSSRLVSLSLRHSALAPCGEGRLHEDGRVAWEAEPLADIAPQFGGAYFLPAIKHAAGDLVDHGRPFPNQWPADDSVCVLRNQEGKNKNSLSNLCANSTAYIIC